MVIAKVAFVAFSLLAQLGSLRKGFTSLATALGHTTTCSPCDSNLKLLKSEKRMS